MEKIFNQKNFNYFIWSPLGSRGNIYINFCIQVHYRWLQPDIVPIDTGGKFAAGVVDTGGKLPPASLTPAAIVDTGGKFATGVNNTRGTGGKICHRCH
jgi:hypothetical protein